MVLYSEHCVAWKMKQYYIHNNTSQTRYILSLYSHLLTVMITLYNQLNLSKSKSTEQLGITVRQGGSRIPASKHG